MFSFPRSLHITPALTRVRILHQCVTQTKKHMSTGKTLVAGAPALTLSKFGKAVQLRLSHTRSKLNILYPSKLREQ